MSKRKQKSTMQRILQFFVVFMLVVLVGSSLLVILQLF
ncbi:hypothetical protein JOC36_001410 [Weissella uvarum]|nr:DUF4044 domain-containing protein [Weissella uvarum]MBM7617833.1 hypothetical protein [Weissella uvarum]MCM0595788.1 DUF4044 domain-containing protein [Weissella uvarum]